MFSVDQNELLVGKRSAALVTIKMVGMIVLPANLDKFTADNFSLAEIADNLAGTGDRYSGQQN